MGPAQHNDFQLGYDHPTVASLRGQEESPSLALDPALAQHDDQGDQQRQQRPMYTQDQLDHFAQLVSSAAPSSSSSSTPPGGGGGGGGSSASANIPVNLSFAPPPPPPPPPSHLSTASTTTASTSVSTSGPPATRASTSAARQPPRPIAPDGALPALQPAHTGKASKDMSAAQKAAMRKERNRLAAQRSRDKRQHEYEAVAAERDRWKAEADSLRAKVRQLEALLKKKSGPPPDAAVPAETAPGGLAQRSR